ncbi:MAG TPA: glutamine-hydrolyzing carbamoyl-phosphate synthase small subunit [Desulfomonilia bacterium]|nr:glutamine-hydrolyzing carbamoyl-phosphate synthase small subunit [Desulfomonilia bacterium]
MAGKAKKPAVLVLEDGTIYRGSAFAGSGDRYGEVVFNTGMSGYQEILTDPSYKEQILVMTYPLIGNYGVNDEDMESAGIHLEGFIVKEYQAFPSNYRSKKNLCEFLEDYGRIGLEGIDTRALTRRIRTRGSMRSVLSTRVEHIDDLMECVRAYPGLNGRDIVKDVTCSEPFVWYQGRKLSMTAPQARSGRLRVVVMDCGVKFNILRMLDEIGCEVIVVPAWTTSREITALDPDGILLSNGPGDPAPLTYLIDTVKDLLGRVPIFGICLGHQILGQALGGKTTKLKFGHHGINQPVKNLKTGRIEISSQNHGFIVLTDTLPKETLVTHINLNDNTLEGLSFPGLKAFSVQYHPEAAPGPKDSGYLFREFIELMEKHTARAA